MNFHFPSPSDLREKAKQFWIMEQQREEDDCQHEAQQYIEEFAKIFNVAALEGKSHVMISNDYGGENDYFINYLISKGYKVKDVSKYCKSVSWK